MILSIDGTRIKVRVSREEHRKINAGLTAKGYVKLPSKPFTIEFVIEEDPKPTADPPSHTPIERELP